MTPKIHRFLVLAAFIGSALPIESAATGATESSRWEVGHAWSLDWYDAAAGQRSHATLVVVKDNETDYEFGLLERDPRFLFSSLLPLGRVARGPLAYVVEGTWFEAVRPPVTPGASWETRLGSLAVVATVSSTSESLAWIDYVVEGGDSIPYRGLYDARSGFFRELIHPNGVVVRISDKGASVPVPAWQPLGVHTLFSRERSESSRPSVAYRGNVLATFNLPVGYAQVSLRMAVLDRSPGFYQVRFQDAGHVYGVEKTPVDTVGPQGRYETREATPSVWAVEQYVAGDATTWAEAVGFRGERITEPVERAPQAAAVPVPAVGNPSWPAIGLAMMVSVGGLAWWYRARFTLPTWLMLARLRPQDVLRHETRERLIQCMRQDPGASSQELRRRLEIPWVTTVHHLRVLEHHGFAAAVRGGRHCNWFALDQVPFVRDRKAAAALRSPRARQLYDYLSAHPGLNQSSLARGVGVRHTTVLYHLRRLIRAELVDPRPYGRRFRFYATPGPPSPEPLNGGLPVGRLA